jgi:hypothetical protein
MPDLDVAPARTRISSAAIVGHARAATGGRGDHEPPIVLKDVLNDPLRLAPKPRIAVMQTRRIKASITAYSTAVGPSSPNRKCRALAKTPVIFDPFPAT